MKTHSCLPQAAPKIVVKSLSAHSPRGVLTYGGLSFPCALGRSGRLAGKREGDGATPIGDVRPAAGFLSAGPAVAAAHAAADIADRAVRRLVRRAARSQLQPSGPAPLSGQRRADVAGGRALRRRRGDGLQRAPAHCRARQRGVHARRRAGIEADRGMHRAGASAPAAAAAGASVRAPSSASRPERIASKKNGPKCRSTGPSLEHA